MPKTGFLLHVYHLEISGWHELVWGDPARDQLGSATKFIECLLNEQFNQPVESIAYSGPSTRDGLSEGAFTKELLVRDFAKLADFPRLRVKLGQLDEDQITILKTRLHNMVLGDTITNTYEEVVCAASHFEQRGIDRVVQIANASHAPRCIQNQSVARSNGLIPSRQQWLTVAADTCYENSIPADTVVIESPSRGDDPLTTFKPQLAAVLKPYFGLSADAKKDFIHETDIAMERVRSKNG